MKDYISNYLDGEFDDPYPDFFFEWDSAVSSGNKPGFYEPEELTEIIEIYFINNQLKRARQAINYALRIYEDDDDLLYEILLLLNDYELWNDLLKICGQYEESADVWIDGHRVTALLHLGMEDESFILFKKLKVKYVDDEDELSIIYQAMGEALCDVDLFDASAEVIQEAINIMGEDIYFYWLQLQCYVSLNNKEAVSRLADIIQKLDPLDAETWCRLGIAFQETGDNEKAIDAFEYAQSLGHNPEEVLKNLIYIYERNKNYVKALDKAKEYLNLYPKDYIVHMMAAVLNSQIEDWTEAVKSIDEALKITPELSSLYLYKSNYLLQMEEYKKAKLTLVEGLNNSKDSNGFLKQRLSKLNKQYPEY
jgi:tetratricopeptide (TPR) repeat protein